ncbi:MAG: hypothetical protein HY051_01970 [Candidatus Aenigmarchaeota archaeon]|nr:hypothetical protein [Candidatus Aenigmarchaeota archaeon]
MADKLVTGGEKRLFIRYVAPKISSDMDSVYNAVREQNQIVLINTKRLRKIDAAMLKRLLFKLQRVTETSGRLVFTIEPDLYITIPKTARTPNRDMTEEEKRMLDEFEKIEMEEEMEDVKKKQGSYKKRLEEFVKKKGSIEKEPLNFEIKKDGMKIKEAIISIKSPFSSRDAGDRMAELMELKSLVSGHIPSNVRSGIIQKIETVKQEERTIREDLMKKRRKVLRKLEAVNDLVESSQISKELFSRIKKELTEELTSLNDIVVGVGSRGVKAVGKKSQASAKYAQKKKAKK